jgi:hypothetical protein
MYFQTESFVTADRKGGLLPRIRNSENFTAKRKISKCSLPGIENGVKIQEKCEVIQM